MAKDIKGYDTAELRNYGSKMYHDHCEYGDIKEYVSDMCDVLRDLYQLSVRYDDFAHLQGTFVSKYSSYSSRYVQVCENHNRDIYNLWQNINKAADGLDNATSTGVEYFEDSLYIGEYSSGAGNSSARRSFPFVFPTIVPSGGNSSSKPANNKKDDDTGSKKTDDGTSSPVVNDGGHGDTNSHQSSDGTSSPPSDNNNNKKEEEDAKKKAEEDAKKKAEEEAKKKAEEEAKKKAEEEAKKKAEEEAKKKAEEEAKKKAEEEAKKKAEEEARKKAEEEARKKAEEEAKKKQDEQKNKSDSGSNVAVPEGSNSNGNGNKKGNETAYVPNTGTSNNSPVSKGIENAKPNITTEDVPKTSDSSTSVVGETKDLFKNRKPTNESGKNTTLPRSSSNSNSSSTSKSGGFNPVPLAIGLGAAVAGGVGIKAYKDHKENSGFNDENEDSFSNGNRFWTEEDPNVINSEENVVSGDDLFEEQATSPSYSAMINENNNSDEMWTLDNSESEPEEAFDLLGDN